MAVITSRFSSGCNNPLAIASTGTALIGVAIAAIGVLALVGVVPGVGSIAALCMVVGGGTLISIGSFGMLKGFVLTNTRLFGSHGEISINNDTPTSDKHTETPVHLTCKNRHLFLSFIEEQFASMSIKTPCAWVDIPVVIGNEHLVFCCKYTSENKGTPSFVWFSINEDCDFCYEMFKFIKEQPWAVSNFAKKTMLNDEKREILERNQKWKSVNCCQISQAKFKKPNLAEES